MSENGKITHIGQLKHDKRNPRKHNPRNLGVVVNSLQQVGFARSIVIDENDEILAGNGVTEAARIAGIEKVVEVEADGETIVAVRRRGLTDEQKQALKYYDNRSSDLAEWDPTIIVSDLELGFDLSNLWTPNEISELLEGAADSLLSTDPANDPNAEWRGMPEFQQENLEAFKSIHVHFKTQEDVNAFAELVGQKVGENTRFIWYPQAEIGTYKDKRYSSEES